MYRARRTNLWQFLHCISAFDDRHIKFYPSKFAGSDYKIIRGTTQLLKLIAPPVFITDDAFPLSNRLMKAFSKGDLIVRRGYSISDFVESFYIYV